jgi:DNA polymerase-3 subunit beta
VSTDGHRLALSDLEVASIGDGLPATGIVPKPALVALRQAVGYALAATGSGRDEYGGEVFLAIEDGIFQASVVMATGMNLKVSSKVVDSNFPPYEKVIPSEADTRFRVTFPDKGSLVDSLKLAVSMTGKGVGVKLKIKGHGVWLHADDGEQEYSEQIESEVSVLELGDTHGMDIGFSPQYLIDAITNLDGDEVTALFIEELDPIALFSDSTAKGIVMPLRLNG